MDKLTLNQTHWKKNITIFLSSQTLSLFGSSLVQYAIMWYITLETKSGIMMTFSILSSFLPAFFLSPFGGVWADRYNKKKMIMLSDTGIAFVTFILAILFMLGYKFYWMVFIVSAVRSLGSAIQTPAVNSFIPLLVPEKSLMRVNGLNGSIQSSIMVLSPALSGALLTIAPIQQIFFIDVTTAIIAVLILKFFLKVQLEPATVVQDEQHILTDIKDGLIYIKNHHYLVTYFMICAIFFVLIVPAAFLTPLQVVRSFGSEVWRLTAIEIAFSTGMILGGLLLASWGGFKNRVKTMILSTIIMGICTILLGFINHFTVYVGIMLLYGIALPSFNTPSMVLLQEKVEPSYMGRVFGIMGMISSSVMPLSMLFFGPIADLIKIEILLLVTGVLILILAIYMASHQTLVKAGLPKKDAEEIENAAVDDVAGDSGQV